MHSLYADFVKIAEQTEADLRAKYDSDPARTGYLSISPRHTIDNLRSLMATGDVSVGDSFLDLGSGLGVQLAAAAKLGLDAYGIELDPDLKAGSDELVSILRRAGEISSVVHTETVNGTYFPADYITLRKMGVATALDYEKKNRNENGSPTEDQSANNQSFFFTGTPDQEAYSKLGKPLQDFDIIFGFLWDSQVPSVYEMFARYAREDAKLLTFGPDVMEDSSAILEDLELTREVHAPVDPSGKLYHVYPFEVVRKK